LVVPVLASSLLAACGGDSSPDATFSKASSDDREAAVSAARGEAAQAATVFAMVIGAAALETGAACPRATLDGDVLTVKGGCSVGGVKLDGKAVIHGFTLGEEDIGVRKVSFDDFGFSQGRDRFSFDGSAEVVDGTGGRYTLLSDLTLTATFEGIRHAVTVSSTLACTDDSVCTAGDDSTVDVDGVGIATITGTWGGGEPEGSLSLVGADTLRVDFDQPTGDRCFTATIDGVAVDPICLEDLEGDIEDDSDGDSVVDAAARVAASSLR
jgi:hypothetical protein